MINVDLIAKLLNLTTSSFDGEALVAVRKANAHLTQHKANWNDFIAVVGDKPDISAQSSGPNAKAGAENWGAIIDDILCRVPAKYHAFLKDVQVYWRQHGRLSAKQQAAIRKFMR
jgi:hypothetical protein